MSVYDNQIATALRLIEAKGMAVTWQSLVNGTPAESDKPWNPGEAVETEHSVSIVFLPMDKDTKKYSQNESDTDIGKGYEKGLMGQVNFTPRIKDTVLRGTETLTVKDFDRLAPNGEIILYKLEFET